MPIFHWYLLKNYLKVLFLSVFSFIAILLLSRLEEIAQFAAMGTKLSYLGLFTLYQIPYILPIAIPFSCLISSLILFQRLSHTHELTALRSCGIPLRRILSPILTAAVIVSILTFYVTSELATASHLATRKMIHDISSVNPLLLLQSSKIARLQDAYVQMNPVRNGEMAKDLVIALHNGANRRLNLCLVKKIAMQDDLLDAHQVNLISSAEAEGFDHLIIENQNSMTSSAAEFAQLLRNAGWKMSNDHLKFSLLRVRQKQLKEQSICDNHAKRLLNKCQSEFSRRISLSLAAFTFTFLGAAFGMEISRNRKARGVLSVLILGALTLVSLIMGKTCSHFFWLSALCYFIPHFILIIASFWTLSRVNRGVE